MIHADGRDWISANEVPDLWPDVSAGTVRAWASRGKVNGHRIGKRVYYDLDELTEAEHQVRTSGAGRPRGPVTSGADRVPSDQLSHICQW